MQNEKSSRQQVKVTNSPADRAERTCVRACVQFLPSLCPRRLFFYASGDVTITVTAAARLRRLGINFVA